MKPITIPAHFNGKHIVLDEPYPLNENTRLVVAILQEEQNGSEQEDWYQTSAHYMAKLQEDEPDYSNATIIKPNPDYCGS